MVETLLVDLIHPESVNFSSSSGEHVLAFDGPELLDVAHETKTYPRPLFLKLKTTHLMDDDSGCHSFLKLDEAVKEAVMDAGYHQRSPDGGPLLLRFSYKDTEGDQLLIASSKALQVALEDCQNNSSSNLRIFVEMVVPPSAGSTVVSFSKLLHKTTTHTQLKNKIGPSHIKLSAVLGKGKKGIRCRLIGADRVVADHIASPFAELCSLAAETFGFSDESSCSLTFTKKSVGSEFVLMNDLDVMDAFVTCSGEEEISFRAVQIVAGTLITDETDLREQLHNAATDKPEIEIAAPADEEDEDEEEIPAVDEEPFAIAEQRGRGNLSVGTGVEGNWKNGPPQTSPPFRQHKQLQVEPTTQSHTRAKQIQAKRTPQTKAPALQTMKLPPLIESLPTDKSVQGKADRKELFSVFDPNGNGYLSLAECDRALIVLGKKLPKPVIMRAFMAACHVAQDNGQNMTNEGESFIEFPEFRLFLVYLKKYTLLWEVFLSLDTGNDRRIDIEEFRKGVKKLGKLGVAIEDPDAEFAVIDADHGGQILFEEFGDWGIQHVYPELA